MEKTCLTAFLRLLVQLETDAPAVRRCRKKPNGCEGPLLDRLPVQLWLAAQRSHHGAQILQGQEIDRRVEQDFAAAIVVMGQKFL